jgi:hypothetical protein
VVLNSSSGTQLTATAAQDVDITAVNGTLNANQVTSQTGNVNLAETGGNLDLGQVSATAGDANLSASGSILNTNASASTPNIMSNAVTLAATTGSIGTGASPITLNPLTGAQLFATAAKDVDVTALNGNLNANQVTSQTGNVNLVVDAGNLNLGVISATAGGANLSASGSILNDNNPSSTVNVTAKSGDLTATTGTIGTDSTPLVLNSSSGTQLVATAAGDVNITALNGTLNANQVTSQKGIVDLTVAAGNLDLGTVTATQGDAVLSASGSILNSDSQTTPNIVSAGGDLTASSGSIGAATAPLLTEVTGTLNALANTNIFMTQSGNLTSQWITANLGSITLSVLNGNASLQSITAPQTINLTVNGTLLNVGLIKAQTINADLTGKGGVATFDKMVAGKTVNVTADNASILNFKPATWGGPVYFGIYVTAGGFNLGPWDPGALVNWNMTSQQFQDWLKRIHFRYPPTPKEKLVTDLTARPGQTGVEQ